MLKSGYIYDILNHETMARNEILQKVTQKQLTDCVKCKICLLNTSVFCVTLSQKGFSIYDFLDIVDKNILLPEPDHLEQWGHLLKEFISHISISNFIDEAPAKSKSFCCCCCFFLGGECLLAHYLSTPHPRHFPSLIMCNLQIH